MYWGINLDFIPGRLIHSLRSRQSLFIVYVWISSEVTKFSELLMTKCFLRKPNELMILYAGQASLYIIEPDFMYFSISRKSVALFLLTSVRPFKATANLHLFHLSIPPNKHKNPVELTTYNYCSSIFTSNPSPPIESWLLNQVSVTSE